MICGVCRSLHSGVLGIRYLLPTKAGNYCHSSTCLEGRPRTVWLGVGLVISRSLVPFPAGALWSVLGQDSLFHIASVYPAAKWLPSINKAVLRACALYAANPYRISLGGLKWFPWHVYRPAMGGR